MPNAPAMKKVFCDENLHIATAGPLLLMHWRGQITPEQFKAVEEAHHELARHYPSGVISFNVADPIAELPNSDTRAYVDDMMKRTGPSTREIVLVTLDTGFVVGVVQSLALKILGMGGKVPIRPFREITPAVSDVTKRHSDVPDPAALSGMLSRLREENFKTLPAD